MKITATGALSVLLLAVPVPASSGLLLTVGAGLFVGAAALRILRRRKESSDFSRGERSLRERAYKHCTIVTSAVKLKVSDRDMWQLTLEILDADQQRVVGPLTFSDFPLSTEESAHEAGVLVARRWIDGEGGAKARAA